MKTRNHQIKPKNVVWIQEWNIDRLKLSGPATPHPPTGEHQPALSSDSDSSIITGLEVGVSNVGLTMEPEGEVLSKS